MILHELKQYLETHGTVSRAELARHFHLSEDGVDAMLEVWMKKGSVSRLIDTCPGGSVHRIRYRLNSRQSLSLTAIL